MYNFRKNKKYIAFTLAEVLITLGIIGIVASITIPTLVKNIQDMQYKTAYKKAFSDASNALMSAKQQELLAYTAAQGDVNHRSNFLAFMNQFKITKSCLANDRIKCWADGESDLYGTPFANSYAFIDGSGRSWAMFDSLSNPLFVIYVDTNGFKKPNQWGKDRFRLNPLTEQDSIYTGTPQRISPMSDNNSSLCFGTNKCATTKDYYGTSWLYK